MTAYAGYVESGIDVQEFDQSDMQARVSSFAAWMNAQLPVSDAAILARARAVFAGTVGENKALPWYAITIWNHDLHDGKMGREALDRLYKAVIDA